MSDTPMTDRERLPVLFVAAGRQRVGKTTFLNAMVQ
jgi:GTP-binding protein EngB required for normal cell division